MTDDDGRGFKKVVRRVFVDKVDRETDLIAVIDIVEVYLGIGTGEVSARARLAEVAKEIERRGGMADEAIRQTLLDVVDRLRKVEETLADAGFEARRSS